MSGVLGLLEPLYAAAWEARRDAYARGWLRSERVNARVVSVGNLSVGGAGKTTLTLHLAAAARARGIAATVVCRRYRPGPGGEGDEERMYHAALGRDGCRAGMSKLALARQAAESGAKLVLVDDGFSHWPLARDVDLVLLDRSDLWGGGRLLPAGRLREPRRALQRASAVIVTRLGANEDPQPWLEQVRPFAPGALLGAARHRIAGVVDEAGRPLECGGAAHVVTATGNPEAVVRSAREAGFSPVSVSAYRDHHWFSAGEARAEAARAGSGTLLLTRKDAVRWPASSGAVRVGVLEVAWEWLAGGEAIEHRVFSGGGAT